MSGPGIQVLLQQLLCDSGHFTILSLNFHFLIDKSELHQCFADIFAGICCKKYLLFGAAAQFWQTMLMLMY